MTQSEASQARAAIQQARKALSEKRNAAARQWATEAARLDPGLEEAWLILAALATPAESVTYLQRALAINPQSARARSGLEWALERLRKSSAEDADITGPVLTSPAAAPTGEVTAPVTVTHTEVDLRPMPLGTHSLDDTARIRVAKAGRKRANPLLVWLGLVLILCITLAAVVLIPLTGVVLAQVNSAEHPLDLLKPTLTLTPTQTALPTATATPLPALTGSPTPQPTQTHTSQPTSSVTATEMPEPTTRPTEIGGIPVVEITPIATLAPVPTYAYADPVTAPTPYTYEPQVPVSGGEHWIDVNLSAQTAAAYDGETLVRSFVVSTGTSEHPTVTGQYNVYVKYRFADMAGPGYYLPDVPYVMYFYRGYGLHGTYWHSNFGTPMSHGCVNFSVDDAAWLFDFVSVGTLVNVHY